MPKPQPSSSRLTLYLEALAAVLVMVGFRWLLTPELGNRLPFVTVFFAVFYSAWRGGLGPALFATVLSTGFCTWFFLTPVGSLKLLDPGEQIGVALFLANGVAVGWLGSRRLEALRRGAAALDQAREAADRAQETAGYAEELTAQAEEERARTRAILDGISDAFLALDLQWRIVYANEQALRIAGTTDASWLGRDAREVFGPNIAQFQDAFRKARDSRQVAQVEALYPPLNKWILATIYPHDQGYSMFAQDVSERRLAESRLRQVQRMEAAGRLAGGVAHEVNNQMTVVLGLTDLILRDHALAPALQDDLLQIRRAGERSAEITAQLLAFSRRQVQRPRVLDLNEVINGFMRVLTKTLGEHSTLRLQLDPKLPTVYGDRSQLEQVLLNLALNAADAMPGGGVLSIETSSAVLNPEYLARHSGVQIATGPYVMMAVSDTGIGMTPEVLGHAFEPFFTTKPQGHGSGLGLSSVYGIVKQSEGYVWAYSEPGQGTVFKLYFPVHQRPSGSVSVHAEPVVTGGKENILVVDDEPAVLALIVRGLNKMGYRTLQAGDGVQALELVRETRPTLDLLLTDIAMPGLNGPGLAQGLGELYPGLHVIYMSGYTDSDVVFRGLLERNLAHLQKPFTTDQLALRIREALDRR